MPEGFFHSLKYFLASVLFSPKIILNYFDQYYNVWKPILMIQMELHIDFGLTEILKNCDFWLFKMNEK